MSDFPHRQALSLASTGDNAEALRLDGNACPLNVLLHVPATRWPSAQGNNKHVAAAAACRTPTQPDPENAIQLHSTENKQALFSHVANGKKKPQS